MKIRPFTNSDQTKMVGYSFYCPGCSHYHRMTINGNLNSEGATWTFSGTEESPTFTPSVLTSWDDSSHRCHLFIRDGNIEFLADCYHWLRGTTVPIPDWELGGGG